MVYPIFLVGIALVITAGRWFCTWVGLEVAVLAYLLMIVKSNYQRQTILLYFIAQVIGRFGLLVAASSVLYRIVCPFILLSLCFKMGFVFGHLWAGYFVIKISGIAALWFLFLLKTGPLWLSRGYIPILVLSTITRAVGLMYIGTTLRTANFAMWGGLLALPWLWFNKRFYPIAQFFVLYSISTVFLFSLNDDAGFLIFSFSGIPPFSLFAGKIMVLASRAALYAVTLLAVGATALVFYSRWISLYRKEPRRLTLKSQYAGWLCVLLRY